MANERKAMTLGRNDPCWCGSGKKYKKCHWSADQKEAAARAELQKARDARLRAFGSPSDSDLRGLYEELTGQQAPTGMIKGEVRQMLTETWQQRRLIEEARTALAPQMEEWDRYFGEHPDEFEAIAREQATNERFNRYELTDENQAKVREALGEVPADPAERRAFATEAIALTLDADDRGDFSEAILSLLPDLVDAGRTKEAYVVVTCADRVLDSGAPISPFLEDVVVRSLDSP